MTINNTFFAIFCFFPLITALSSHSIYFYFFVGIAWVVFLICRDSLKKTIVDLWKYVLRTPFFFFLGAIAIYIAFNFYLLSPYKSPTVVLQFLPFHVTSAFGLFLLYIANREHFSDKVIVYSLVCSIIVYLVFCTFFVLQNVNAAGLILRNMLPFLLVVISCLLVMVVYKMFRRSPRKKIFIYMGIVLINALVAFYSDGNTTKLVFLLSLVIAIISYIFRRILFSIMSFSLILALLFPLAIASIKDFSILNTKGFDAEIRSIQTRIPQWIDALDLLEKKPITGLGVYAAYYVGSEGRKNYPQEAVGRDTIPYEEGMVPGADEAKQLEIEQLNTKLTKIINSFFLVERTNNYYSLRSNISDPDYGDIFVKEMEVQLEYIRQALEIITELKKIQLNSVVLRRSDDFQRELARVATFLQEYKNSPTYNDKHIVLKKELKRFLLDHPGMKITRHPHNIVVQVLLELGMVGLCMLASILFFILYKISKIENLLYQTIGYILFFIFITIYSTSSSIWYIDFHQIMYITAFLFLIVTKDQNQELLHTSYSSRVKKL